MSVFNSGVESATGGCHCGSIRYFSEESSEPDPEVDTSGLDMSHGAHVNIDHCGTCRKATGGLPCIWYSVPANWVNFLLGGPSGVVNVPAKTLLEEIHSKRLLEPKDGGVFPESTLGLYSTSLGVVRGFCRKCGTPVFYAKNKAEDPEREWRHETVDFVAGSLDEGVLENIRPVCQSFVEHGVGWVVDWCKTGKFGDVLPAS